MVTARWCPWVTSHCDSHHHHKRKIVNHTPYIIIVQPSISRVNSSRELYCFWLLYCWLNAPNYQLLLVLAYVFFCLLGITSSKAALEQSSRAWLYFCRAPAVCRWISALFFHSELFNMCIVHGYIPNSCLNTTIVPICKNNMGVCLTLQIADQLQ